MGFAFICRAQDAVASSPTTYRASRVREPFTFTEYVIYLLVILMRTEKGVNEQTLVVGILAFFFCILLYCCKPYTGTHM